MKEIGIWCLMFLILLIHYLFLTGFIGGDCKNGLFNSDGVGELVFAEAGSKWILTEVNLSDIRYFDGKHLLHDKSEVLTLRDTCQLKRKYLNRRRVSFEDSPAKGYEELQRKLKEQEEL